MKTAKSIIVVLFVLLTAQIASAYYCPSTGRWPSRDPIGEPGFQTAQMASVVRSIAGSPQLAPSRWINRDPLNELGRKLLKRSLSTINLTEENNLYRFVQNTPPNYYDLLGLREGWIPVPDPNPLPPFDPNHPEKPSKKKVCRLLSATRPGTMFNPGCIKCWKCTYQCSPPGVGGGGAIQKWQIGGCLSVVGFVPGFDDPTDCEGATKNGPPTGLYPGDLDP